MSYKALLAGLAVLCTLSARAQEDKVKHWQEMVERLATQSGLKSTYTIKIESNAAKHYIAYALFKIDTQGISTGTVGINSFYFAQLTADEQEGALAHEIGHYFYKHPQKSVVALLAQWIGSCSAAGTAYGTMSTGLGGRLAAAVVVCYGLYKITDIARCYMSRNQEFQADAHAIALTGNIPALEATLQKRRDWFESKDKQTSWLFQDHPTSEQRIAQLHTKRN